MTKKRNERSLVFSKTLTQLMDEKRLTIRQIAKMAKVGASTIGGWKSGAAPQDFMAVKRLADALGVDMEFLLTGKTNQKKNEPTISEVLKDGGTMFEGICEIQIRRLIPRKKGSSDDDF